MWHVWGARRGVYSVLVGKPEGMRPFGRPRHKWEDNIKMDLQEVGLGRGAHPELIWLRIGSCECSNKPAGSIIMQGIF
jgi:hypothetical protein